MGVGINFDNIFKPVSDIANKAISLIPDPNKAAEIIKELELANMAAQSSYESNLTERAKADMMSDSWLSKNIRPIALIVLSLCFFVMNILSYFDIEASEKIMSIIENLLLMVFGFYFGGRSLEKVGSMVSNAIRNNKK